MPPAIDTQIRKQVIKHWLEGHTRDKIAADNRIGAGTVTDIDSEWREGIDEVEYESINVFKKSEEELRKYGLSMESPQKLVSVLHAISDLECDPQKIVKELAWIKSVRQTERRLKVNYKILKSRTTRYQEIIHLREQLISLGIGFAELSAFHAAIFKKIEMENLPYGEALYSLMDGIETSEKLAYAKKQLNDICKQIQFVNVFWARQNDALNALIKLHSFGVTIEEILNIHEFMSRARLENTVLRKQ